MEKSADLESLKERYSYDLATPMMQQFLDIKFQHMDCLLLFRMGDFYELFFDDAIKASKILGIALAKRGKHAGENLAMCGVPHHSLESYLLKLLDYGAKVAICEQKETPEEAKKRGYKAVVKREVVRIITPGTILEESIIDDKQPNYLTSIAIDNQLNCTLCYVDISTSEIAITRCKLDELSSKLINLNPKEILISDRWQYNDTVINALVYYHNKVLYQVDSLFAKGKNEQIIKEFYKLQSINSIGNLTENDIIALGVLLQYVKNTQKQHLPCLPTPHICDDSNFMFIDAATRKNLEVTTNLQGKYQGSLLSVINHCVSKQGSRLLYQYLSNPLTDINKLNRRLDLTDYFQSQVKLQEFIRSNLKLIGDLDRILAKVATQRAIAADISAISNIISIASEIKAALYTSVNSDNAPLLLKDIELMIGVFDELQHLINSAISPDAPNNFSSTGIILPSYHPKIAELNDLVNNSEATLVQLQTEYRALTGVENLKITRNNVLGYYVEVTAKNAGRIKHEEFVHRQSTQNAVRFSTERLSVLETNLTSANIQLHALEQEIWQDICAQVLTYQAELQKLAHALSMLDVFTNFAFIAEEFNFCRPEFTSNEIIADIESGRHLVVEQYLKKEHQDFTANDCTLQEQDNLIWLLTGPNMAGKSTFLRQNALIIILAQLGCFIPAKKAKLSLTDKLFSRIGASDDLAKGQSTFMVEMIETSAILNQATENSFIILDEVGRGTSTFDGMSIAWAILEYLHDKIKCRSLFATHYHELTSLSEKLPSLANYSIKIDDTSGELIFLHQITEGSADKSYGIHVAELAGLPKAVLNRAEDILDDLENSNNSIAHHQLNLTTAKPKIKEKIIYKEKPSILEQEMASINPDELSPKEALELIYKLKNSSI